MKVLAINGTYRPKKTTTRLTEKALKLVVERPGDEFAHGLDAFRFVRREWTTFSVDIPATGS